MPDQEPGTNTSNGFRWVARWLAGLVFGDVSAGVLFVVTGLIAGWIPQDFLRTAVIVPSLFLVPFAGGVFAAWIWHPLRLSITQSILSTVGMSLIVPFAAFYFLKEGIICLLIVLPLFFVAQLAGVLAGRVWAKHNRSHLRISLLALLPLLVVSEPLTREELTGVVTDEIVIKAPATRVWSKVVAFPKITAEPNYWLFRIGLPYPEETTSTGNFVGANRQCIFSGHAVFQETVQTIDPAKELTFSIDEIPRDPELLGHLTPRKGQFLLHDNGDGTTTLTGKTWYTLHVRPLWYFDWWTHAIFQAVHLRVMNDIKSRAEAAL